MIEHKRDYLSNILQIIEKKAINDLMMKTIQKVIQEIIARSIVRSINYKYLKEL